METWEMIKELTENPRKVFAVICEESQEETLVSAEFGKIIIKGYQKLFVGDEWKEVKQPISFMEAFKAFRNERKDIICIYKGIEYGYSEGSLGSIAFDEDFIDDGEWHIK